MVTSNADLLLQFFFVRLCFICDVCVVLFFPPHLSYFWCLGRAVPRDCGFSWVSSLFDDSFPKISTRNDDIHPGLRWNFNVSAHLHTFCKHPQAIKVFRCQQCLYLERQLNTKVLMLEKAGSIYYLLSSFTGLPLPVSILFDNVYAGSPNYMCMYMALSFILYVSSMSVLLWLFIISNDSATNQVSSEVSDLLEAENALIVYSGFAGFI